MENKERKKEKEENNNFFHLFCLHESVKKKKHECLISRVFITNMNLYCCMVLRTSRGEAGIVNHSCLVFSFHFLGFTFHNADIFASC